jgi:hypothetical protein
MPVGSPPLAGLHQLIRHKKHEHTYKCPLFRHKVPIHGIEELEIQLVDEGVVWGRSIIFAYLTPGSGRIQKHKFVARVTSSPHGPYNFDSESFEEPITLASFDHLMLGIGYKGES